MLARSRVSVERLGQACVRRADERGTQINPSGEDAEEGGGEGDAEAGGARIREGEKIRSRLGQYAKVPEHLEALPTQNQIQETGSLLQTVPRSGFLVFDFDTGAQPVTKFTDTDSGTLHCPLRLQCASARADCSPCNPRPCQCVPRVGMVFGVDIASPGRPGAKVSSSAWVVQDEKRRRYTTFDIRRFRFTQPQGILVGGRVVLRHMASTSAPVRLLKTIMAPRPFLAVLIILPMCVCFAPPGPPPLLKLASRGISLRGNAPQVGRRTRSTPAMVGDFGDTPADILKWTQQREKEKKEAAGDMTPLGEAESHSVSDDAVWRVGQPDQLQRHHQGELDRANERRQQLSETLETKNRAHAAVDAGKCANDGVEGRVIVKKDASGDVTDMTPAAFNVRTRVHEYGGGAWTVKQ
eukprot:2948915-Rhodomonas_salina.3